MRKPSRIGSRQDNAQSRARLMWKRSATSPKGWSCSKPCRPPLSAPSKNSRCKSPWALRYRLLKALRAPEVEQVYTRARELCRQVGETPQLFPVLWGLWAFYHVRAEYKTARELAEQLLQLGPERTRPHAPPV